MKSMGSISVTTVGTVDMNLTNKIKSAVFMLLLALPLSAAAQGISADIILVNGSVHTVDADDSVAEALALAGDRIIAVGSTTEISELAGDGTRVVDLAGRTVIPGLIDTHTHAIRSGIREGTEVDWADATSLAEGLRRIRAFVDRTPEDAWVVVTSGWHGGWHPTQFEENRLPTPEEITEAARGRPAYVRPVGNLAILSPAALSVLGIESDADVQPGGQLELDDQGIPTGRIFGQDGWTFTPIVARIPRLSTTFDEQMAGTKAFFTKLNRYGLTGVIDPSGMGMPPPNYRPLFEVWRRGGLTLRVAFHVGPQTSGAELEELKSMAQLLPQGFGDDMLHFNGFGEALILGLTDGPRTLLEYSPSDEARAALPETLGWIAEGGYTAKIHASSDLAARTFLDVIEVVNEETPVTDLRWSFEHLNNPGEDTIARMKALGMIHGMQNLTYYAGEELVETIGREAALMAPPIRTEIDAGLMIAGGTDAPESPYNPWVAIRWFLDGKSVLGNQVRSTDQLATRDEALRMWTAHAAYMSFDENDRGSLEPGKLADLAVLNESYFTVPVEEIAEIESLLTIVDGRIVYAAEPFVGLR